jgi:hypothetical protein
MGIEDFYIIFRIKIKNLKKKKKALTRRLLPNQWPLTDLFGPTFSFQMGIEKVESSFKPLRVDWCPINGR